MTDQSSVFNNEEQPQQEPLAQEQPQSGDVFSDQLKTITTEDGRQKYDSVDKAIEALAHSQTYIPELQGKLTAQEQELAQLREELAKSKAASEVIEKSAQNHQELGQQGNPSEAPIGEEKVAQILEATLEKRLAAQKSAENSKLVEETLTAKYGTQAAEQVKAKAKELGVTPSKLGELAQQSPALVLGLFGAEATSATPTSNSFKTPLQQQEIKPVGRPEKSLLAGASSKDQADYMRQIREETYRKHGITG